VCIQDWQGTNSCGNVSVVIANAVKPPAALLACLLAAAPVYAAPAVDYGHEVKPLLAEHCYRCHGASQQKNSLRMDTAVFARQGGDNGPGYLPGRSADSLLVQVVKGTHPDIPRMPYKKPPLNDAQIALLQRWIDQGADAPADEEPEKRIHWSFIRPSRPELPKVKQTDWPRNPIDRFILTRLEKEHILPAPEADRSTLIRRVKLDLTGLPPTPEEVRAFLRDERSDAYERIVDRLLASPHYGERWVRPNANFTP